MKTVPLNSRANGETTSLLVARRLLRQALRDSSRRVRQWTSAHTPLDVTVRSDTKPSPGLVVLKMTEDPPPSKKAERPERVSHAISETSGTWRRAAVSEECNAIPQKEFSNWPHARRDSPVMGCTNPLQGWRSAVVEPSGKRRIVFDIKAALRDAPVEVPCGQCAGCRLERARQWAVRCMHEASLHEENCFITLTYDNQHLPLCGSLCVKDFQRFMKRVRKSLPGKKIRYYHCGEYGDQFGRPHFHAAIFGHRFTADDLVPGKGKEGQNQLYVSRELQALWTKGFSTMGEVTFESAAYVARYVMKKQTGKGADTYWQVEPDGEILGAIAPPYSTMSNGIGRGWYEKFKTDVYPSDELVMRGHVQRPPRFYDTLYEEENAHGLNQIKAKRLSDAKRKMEGRMRSRVLQSRDLINRKRTKER